MYRTSVIRTFPIARVLVPIEACRVIWQLAAAGEACVTFKQDRLATHRIRPGSSLERHGAKKEADRAAAIESAYPCPLPEAASRRHPASPA